jgi:hypothetical protein
VVKCTNHVPNRIGPDPFVRPTIGGGSTWYYPPFSQGDIARDQAERKKCIDDARSQANKEYSDLNKWFSAEMAKIDKEHEDSMKSCDKLDPWAVAPCKLAEDLAYGKAYLGVRATYGASWAKITAMLAAKVAACIKMTPCAD